MAERMANKDYKDVISYKQDTYKVLSDEATLKLYGDKNLWPVLKFLRDSGRPMTVKDLEATFKEEARFTGDKALVKSDKTIYRYLSKLEEGGLVIQAGMRMYSDKTRAQTLYTRPAKLFLPDYSAAENAKTSAKKEKEASRVIKGVEALICNYFGYKKGKQSEAGINKLVQKFFNDFYDRKIQLVQKSEDVLDELIKDLDPREIESMFFKACNLVLLSENGHWEKALQDCFQER